MKKYLLTLLTLVSIQQLSSAQNLLNNPDFEQYISCPSALGEIHYCNNWWSANNGSPDYFNSCDQSTANVPNGYFGYQPAYNGNAYAGIICYMGVAPQNTREYISQKLATPMEIGAHYKVSMKVSMSNRSQYTMKGIGAYFYTDTLAIDTAHVHQLNVTPQIDYTPYGFITDTVNWLTLSDSFVASETFDHIIIGCFKTDNVLDTSLVNANSFLETAYYFIDGVIVEKITSTGINGVATINPTISPIPLVTVSKLTFSNMQQLAYQLNIFDVQGRMIRRIENIRKSEIIIERGDLNSGCYFYELKSEDGAVAKGKLFVQ